MKTLIRADQIVDGNGGKPIAKGALLFEDGRILAVGREADIGVPDGARVIETTSGSTVIPGLCDTHVHLAYSGSTDAKAFRAEHAEMSYAAVALRAAAYAGQTLRAGFTSVRDMHAPGGTVIDLRDAVNSGLVTGPRIKACGRGLCPTGGHMDQPGWADHVQFRDLTAPCDGPIGFRRGVREQIKRGADFIKLNTWVSCHGKDGRYWRPEMADDEIKAACDEAHALGVLVAAHTYGSDGVAHSVANGVDCIEHGHWIDDPTVELMHKHGTFFCPTLTVNQIHADMAAGDPSLDEGSRRWHAESSQAKWVTLQRIREAGIRVVTGTDSGFMLPHAKVNAHELTLLVRGGFSPLEAITAATATACDLLGIDAGRLQAGRLADVVVVSGDPVADISILEDASCLRVFKGGVEAQ